MSSRDLSSSPVGGQTTAFPSKKRKVLAILVRLASAGAVFGSLKLLGIPTLTLVIMACFGLLVALVMRFIRDNLSLAAQFSRWQFAKAFGTACVMFLPILVLILPGLWLGNYIGQGIDWLILQIQAWASPDTKIIDIPELYVPWWGKPVAWMGFEAIVTKVHIVQQEVSIPKGGLIAMCAGVATTSLLAISFWANAWTAMLGVRAFAGLFGRIFVVMGTPPVFSIYPEGTPTTHVSRPDIGKSFQFRLLPNMAFLTRRHERPINAPQDFHLARNHGAFFARLRSRLIRMCRVCNSDGQTDYEYLENGSRHFIPLQLDEGQSVSLDLNNVVGFADTVRFSQHWNLNLCRLAVRKAVWVMAHGPGAVLVKTDGQPRIFMDASMAPSVSPEELLVLEADTTVAVDAKPGCANIFFSGCNIKPVSGGLVVIGPAPAPPTTVKALWNLVVNVYWPF